MKNTVIIFFIVASVQLLSQDRLMHNIPCEKVMYPVTFHNIAYYSDSFFEYSNFNVLLDFTNAMFSNTCIEFYLCKRDSIPNYNFYNMKDEMPANEDSMIVELYYEPHTINVYQTLNLTKAPFNGICKNSKNEKPAIFLSDSLYTFQSVKFAFFRLMIDYFGLPYMADTATIAANKELVNGSNSDTTADRIWDTPADPFFSVFNNTSLYRPGLLHANYYTYIDLKDANGEYYNPIRANVRSMYSSFIENCLKLTRGQYQFIVNNERQCREKRW